MSHADLARLDRDWQAVRGEHLSEPWEHLTAQQTLDLLTDDPQPWLRAMVRAAQAGDHVAGRVVVQSLVGLMCHLIRRDSRLRFPDLVAAVWIRMHRPGIAERSGSLSATLVLDARKDVLAELRPLPVTVLVPPGPRHAASDVLRCGVEHGIIDARSAMVMGSVYVDGLTSGEAGARHGMSAAAVRWRCSRGVHRLASQRETLVA